jgi:tetratricopeptide (TPR) repeat protein
MPDRCDKCGIVALESEQFVEEGSAFRRRRRYCPACHQKYRQRVYLCSVAVLLLLAGFEIRLIHSGKKEFQDYSPLWWILVFLIQWVMIVPHELGHAIAARLLGYTQIRILIGAGKPIVSFDFGGFYWVVNAIPLGGLTLVKIAPKLHRWKHLAFVSSGLVFNLAVVIVAWFFIGPGELFSRTGNVSKLLFWANIIVIGENLIPRVVPTAFGPSQTDGLQIWRLLFEWGKAPKERSPEIPSWEVFICHVLKWSIFVVVLGVAIGFAYAGLIPFLEPAEGLDSLTLHGKRIWLLIAWGLSALCGWLSWRIFKEPISKIRTMRAGYSMARQFRSSLTIPQLKALQRATLLLKDGKFDEAEVVFDELLALLPERSSDAYILILLTKLHCMIGKGEVEQAEKVCLEFVEQAAGKEQKIKVLDGMASYILYQNCSPFLKKAEGLVRMALEIAPGTLTLKGTLGSILAEQGNYSEAEPLLIECLDRSPALQDRAISTFYLGLIKLRTYDAKEGEQLITRGMKLYPEAWIVARGNALLKETGNQPPT